MYYSLVVIILFGTGLYKSVFSTYFFGKLGFRSSVFWFFMFLDLWFLAFIFMFYVLNSMSFLIMPDVITLFIFFYQFIQGLIYKLGWLFTKSLVFHRFKSCLEKHFFLEYQNSKCLELLATILKMKPIWNALINAFWLTRIRSSLKNFCLTFQH